MYRLFTDGGSRGNPGPAGLGAIIFDDDNKLVSFINKFIKLATNNEAEYSALIMGLGLAKKNNIKEVECFLDSELVVKQMNGEYKIKKAELKVLKHEVDTLMENFKQVKFIHVRREKNKYADRLVNLAMDNVLKI